MTELQRNLALFDVQHRFAALALVAEDLVAQKSYELRGAQYRFIEQPVADHAEAVDE